MGVLEDVNKIREMKLFLEQRFETAKDQNDAREAAAVAQAFAVAAQSLNVIKASKLYEAAELEKMKQSIREQGGLPPANK